MRTVDEIIIQAEPDSVFSAASKVENWPQFLPHYRWVRILDSDQPDGRHVEMAARRGMLPVKWTALQALDGRNRRVYYRHTGGPTRGMRVEWQVEPRANATHVAIIHDLSLEVPLVRTRLGKWIVARFFINRIATQTLSRMKRFLEESW